MSYPFPRASVLRVPPPGNPPLAGPAASVSGRRSVIPRRLRLQAAFLRPGSMGLTFPADRVVHAIDTRRGPVLALHGFSGAGPPRRPGVIIGVSRAAGRRPPAASMLAGIDLGDLGRRSFFLRGRGRGEEFIRARLEKHSGFEKFASEDEASPHGDLGSARELDAVGENYTDAACPGAAGSPRTVRIDRIFLRQIEADDMAHCDDVQTAGAQIARNEIADLAAREAFQGDTASFLFHGRVDRGDGKAVRGETFGRRRNAARLGNEDETALGANGGLEAPDEVESLAPVAVEAPMFDAAGEDGILPNGYFRRLVKQGTNLAPDAFGQSGRNEYARAFFRSGLDQGRGERDRFGCHKPVGLVEDEIAKPARAYSAESDQIGKTAECPDDDVRTVAQLRDLLIEGRTAEHDGSSHSQAGGRNETICLASYLDGQLLRGRRDYHSRFGGAPASRFREDLHRRGVVCEGLAGTGLGLDESVAAIEHEGHSGLLYGSRPFETER